MLEHFIITLTVYCSSVCKYRHVIYFFTLPLITILAFTEKSPTLPYNIGKLSPNCPVQQEMESIASCSDCPVLTFQAGNHKRNTFSQSASTLRLCQPYPHWT